MGGPLVCLYLAISRAIQRFLEINILLTIAKIAK